jgi:predicted DNA-binding protein (MmcQ/YjbR family)
MKPNDFRRIALGMQGAIESAHMGHPDFRANGRIFATLSADNRWGMVKLPPERQEELVRADRSTFVPAKGTWGRQGCTMVQLASADAETIGEAMSLAWQQTAKARAKTQVRKRKR